MKICLESSGYLFLLFFFFQGELDEDYFNIASYNVVDHINLCEIMYIHKLDPFFFGLVSPVRKVLLILLSES